MFLGRVELPNLDDSKAESCIETRMLMFTSLRVYRYVCGLRMVMGARDTEVPIVRMTEHFLVPGTPPYLLKGVIC